VSVVGQQGASVIDVVIERFCRAIDALIAAALAVMVLTPLH
jgi:hypothetical protein